MQIVIKSVSGKGFLTFKDTFIQDFEKFGNTPVLIVGENKVDAKSLSNGSGKSSLIEALNFVFFGETGRALKYADEVINWDSDECAVSSIIQVGEEEYTIFRERKIGKATTLTIYHPIENDKHEEILPQADNKTKQLWLESLLGFSFTSWSCAVMFHQDFIAFPDLKPAQRAEILSEVAGLDIYLDAAKEASKRFNIVYNRAILLEKDITTKNEELDRLKTINYQEKVDTFESDRQQKIIMIRKQQREEQTKDKTEKELARKELVTNGYKIEETNEKTYQLESKKTLPMEDPLAKEISEKIIFIEKRKEEPFTSPELDSRILELENELKSAPQIEELLRDQIKTEAEIKGGIAVLIRDIEKINKEIHRFQNIGTGECPTCKQEVSAEHLQTHLFDMEADLCVLETKRQEQNEKMESNKKNMQEILLTYDALQSYRRVLEEKRMERNKKELNHIEAIGVELAHYKDQKQLLETNYLNHLNSQINVFRNHVHALQLERQALEIKIASNAGETLVAALEKQIESERQTTNPYIDLKERNDQQIQLVEGEINHMQGEVTEKRDQGNYLSYWIDGYKKLRMMMFDSLIIRLEELSQDFLSDYSSELSVSIVGEKDLKSGAKKDEIFIEIINEKGKKSSFEAYSGGERQKVKMAVSLALSEVIKEKCGKDFNLIIFDEPNDSLDDIGKDTNFQVFKSIAEKKTLLCVDHDGYFKDRFDQTITIVKEAEGSRIKT